MKIKVWASDNIPPIGWTKVDEYCIEKETNPDWPGNANAWVKIDGSKLYARLDSENFILNKDGKRIGLLRDDQLWKVVI